MGEVWELTIRIPGQPVKPHRFVVMERGHGDYWSMRVASIRERDGQKFWEFKLFVDCAYWRKQRWLNYIGPAGPEIKRKLGLS